MMRWGVLDEPALRWRERSVRRHCATHCDGHAKLATQCGERRMELGSAQPLHEVARHGMDGLITRTREDQRPLCGKITQRSTQCCDVRTVLASQLFQPAPADCVGKGLMPRPLCAVVCHVLESLPNCLRSLPNCWVGFVGERGTRRDDLRGSAILEGHLA
jgi:hypothetical protein